MKAKVFGIGLSKTGTKTLGACFKHFGMKHLSGRRDLLALYREGRIFEAFAVIDGYESFEDDPYPYMYRELFIRYGETARFIMTKRRDPQTWLESLKAHCLRTQRSAHWHLLGFGYPYPHGAEKDHLDFYERHELDVRHFFRRHGAEDRLLEVCWETGDGWDQLCTFLGMPIPLDPFPYENRGGSKPVDPAILASNVAGIRHQLILLNRPADAVRFMREMAPSLEP